MTVRGALRRNSDGGLLALAVLGIAIRLVIVFAPFLPTAGLWEDAAIGRNLARGIGFVQDPSFGPTAVKAPAYPFLLAALAQGDPDDAAFLRASGMLNALLGGVAILLCGTVARRLFGDTAGLVSALLVALHPTHAYLARIPESTNLSVVLVPAAVLAAIRASRATSRLPWVVAGVAGGLAILSNPVSGVGLVLTWILLGRSLHKLVLTGLLAGLILVPWTIRNYLVFEQFIAVKSPFWLDVYAGFLPENLGGHQLLSEEMMHRVVGRAAGQSDIARERIYKEEMTAWIAENRALTVRTMFWRVGQYWGLYGQRPHLAAPLDILFRILPEGLLLALALLGGYRAWGYDRIAFLVLAAFLLSYTAAYSAIVAVNVRYHLEVVWAEAILAAVALRYWLEHRAAATGTVDQG